MPGTLFSLGHQTTIRHLSHMPSPRRKVSFLWGQGLLANRVSQMAQILSHSN